MKHGTKIEDSLNGLWFKPSNAINSLKFNYIYGKNLFGKTYFFELLEGWTNTLTIWFLAIFRHLWQEVMFLGIFYTFFVLSLVKALNKCDNLCRQETCYMPSQALPEGAWVKSQHHLMVEIWDMAIFVHDFEILWPKLYIWSLEYQNISQHKFLSATLS